MGWRLILHALQEGRVKNFSTNMLQSITNEGEKGANGNFFELASTSNAEIPQETSGFNPYPSSGSLL